MSEIHGEMYDTQGNVVLCKCGKPAVKEMIGINMYIAQCESCLPCDILPVKLIYKPVDRTSSAIELNGKFIVDLLTIEGETDYGISIQPSD